MNRLETICSLIPKGGTIADIGCDHGKVSEFIAKKGLAERLIVNDMSAASLQKAQDLLGAVITKTKIVFMCCDGAQLMQGLDCVVIAGMGGREILKILNSTQPECAVLAPQNYMAELRTALAQSSYTVNFDKTVSENGKFYDIMRVINDAQSKIFKLDACAAQYGYCYKEKNSALLARLKRDEHNLLSYKQTAENLEKLQIIQEVLSWQQ